jgi:putative ABC transport system permease protein
MQFIVSPGYLDVMATPVALGRGLTAADQESLVSARYPEEETRERLDAMSDAERREYELGQAIPVVVNETMAHRYWPGVSPVGETFWVGAVDPDDPQGPVMTVVGMVPEVRTKRMDEPPWAQFYVPAATFSRWLVVRTAVDPGSLAEALRAELQAVDSTELRVASARTMDDLFRSSTAESRSLALLVAAFALLSTVLAAIGLFGVMAYSVACRTHEIGVRMSMGARPAEIFRLVLSQGMTLALAGVGLGLVGSIVLTRYIASLLFGVSPLDWGTLLTVSLILAIVALVACYLPTRRASRVDPLTALRSE